jgi:hypothetical protein
MLFFNDQFTTVSSIDREIDPPSHWEDLCLESAVIIVTDHPTTYLKDDWLTKEELEENRRDLQREKAINLMKLGFRGSNLLKQNLTQKQQVLDSKTV